MNFFHFRLKNQIYAGAKLFKIICMEECADEKVDTHSDNENLMFKVIRAVEI